ncbi:hypothetical protein [Streptomyces sp. NPDC091217]|uniref:hypothetical protein n=1 Tax=Streptomyces sp. NPDC091217 TaxID=3365975 RepID=UPI00382C94F7
MTTGPSFQAGRRTGTRSTALHQDAHSRAAPGARSPAAAADPAALGTSTPANKTAARAAVVDRRVMPC